METTAQATSTRYNHDTDCLITIAAMSGRARAWLHSDERTIVVDSWDDNGEMHQETRLPGDPGYAYLAGKMGI